MKAKLHHIGIAVRDLDDAVPRYEQLYGTTFRRVGDAISGPSGVAVAACWRVGIELVSPLPGADNFNAKVIRHFLDTRGEGIFSVAHAVDNFDDANARAEAAGLPLTLRLNLTREEIDRELGGAFERFEETCFSGFDAAGMGYMLSWNLIEWKARPRVAESPAAQS